MFKINLSGNNKIWWAQKIWAHCPEIPPWLQAWASPLLWKSIKNSWMWNHITFVS